MLILDEPTSSLDADEVVELFRVINALKADGVAILFVSHFLDQVYEIADRLTVLRNGKLVGEYMTEEILRIELVHKMIGKDLAVLEDLESHTRAVVSEDHESETVPHVEAIGLGRKGSIAPFDLKIHEGEIVGLAGLLGSGRTELARLLAGADRADSGELVIEGSPTRLRSPRAALKRRIAYSSEDRKREGIVEDLTVRDNIVLALQADRGWLRRIPRRRQDELTQSYISALNIRPANPEAIVGNLSGGNQQKVLLARWLAVAPRLLILDEPTRGIDIGAKAEIQRLVLEPGRGGHGGALHLGGTRGGAPAEPSHRRDPGPAQGRRPRERRRQGQSGHDAHRQRSRGMRDRVRALFANRLAWPLIALVLLVGGQRDQVPGVPRDPGARRAPLRQPHRHHSATARRSCSSRSA